MSDSSNAKSTGISLSGAMFILFLALRLTDHIDWAWYWIAAPLWMPLVAILGVLLVVVAVAMPIAALIDWRVARRIARIRRARRGG